MYDHEHLIYHIVIINDMLIIPVIINVTTVQTSHNFNVTRVCSRVNAYIFVYQTFLHEYTFIAIL